MKFSGKQCSLMLLASGATPVYGDIAQVQEIGAIDQTADELDVTTLDNDEYRDTIPGFKDAGESQVTLIFDPALPSHSDAEDGLYGIFQRGETRKWAIKIHSSIAGGFAWGQFDAYVRDWSWGAINADDPQTVAPTLRLRTGITLTDTAPVMASGGTRSGIGDAIPDGMRKAA